MNSKKPVKALRTNPGPTASGLQVVFFYTVCKWDCLWWYLKSEDKGKESLSWFPSWCCDKCHEPKQFMEERIYLTYNSSAREVRVGTPAEAQTWTMGQCSLLACSPWIAQPAFFCNQRSPVHRWHILYQSLTNTAQTCLQAIWWKHLHSWVSLACVGLDKN